MEGQPPAPVERPSRSHWFARLTAPQTRRVALLLVLVATAAFGGLDTVNKQLTPFKPGEEFNDGQFTVTVERARLVDELKGTYGSAKPGMKYLGVVTTLRNDGKVPGRLNKQLELRGVADAEFFGVFRLRDGSAIATLGPGLTEQLAFSWLLPDAVAESLDDVTIRVWKKTYTQLMVTYGGKEWINTDNYGEVVVPVKGQA
ncbi:hypothetical protein [Mycolicibacterium sp. 120270]|uniref:hypothetical protein n=1 Tax=Mycolicibacterium sp. 120270 TaxID=3090600 RepID=UPI00299D0DCF|nr:hypothetical protein [Mycolicibacterium sp. 120270]MDX1886180.1 hypothetical protein [Mycolicibacterium sp. 120270]